MASADDARTGGHRVMLDITLINRWVNKGDRFTTFETACSIHLEEEGQDPDFFRLDEFADGRVMVMVADSNEQGFMIMEDVTWAFNVPLLQRYIRSHKKEAVKCQKDFNEWLREYLKED
jgi:hypothetical protein